MRPSVYGPKFACVEVTGIMEAVDYSVRCLAGGRLNPETVLLRREQQLGYKNGFGAFFFFFLKTLQQKEEKRFSFFWKETENKSSIKI